MDIFLLTSNYVDVYVTKRFFWRGGLQKKYSVYKVFPINGKNELCGRFHTLKEFSSGGTKFCVNKISMISVYQIGVKVTLY